MFITLVWRPKSRNHFPKYGWLAAKLFASSQSSNIFICVELFINKGHLFLCVSHLLKYRAYITKLLMVCRDYRESKKLEMIALRKLGWMLFKMLGWVEQWIAHKTMLLLVRQKNMWIWPIKTLSIFVWNSTSSNVLLPQHSILIRSNERNKVFSIVPLLLTQKKALHNLLQKVYGPLTW